VRSLAQLVCHVLALNIIRIIYAEIKINKYKITVSCIYSRVVSRTRIKYHIDIICRGSHHT